MYSQDLLEKAAMIASKFGWENVDLPGILMQLKAVEQQGQNTLIGGQNSPVSELSPQEGSNIPPEQNNVSETPQNGLQ